MIYRFWLHPWYLLAFVLSGRLWYTDSVYTLGIFRALCCLFLYDTPILITPLVSFGHWVFCSSMICRFWLPLGIFWPLCCLFFYDIQILITTLVSFGHCAVCSSMIYRFWLHLWYLLVISSSMIYRFWLHPWYLLAIVFSVLLWYTDSDYTLVMFCPLCCLFFYDIQILIIPWYLLAIVLSVLLWYIEIWLHPCYLLAIVLSVLLWYTDSDYTLGIFWPLCCLFFYDIQILITPLVSFGHCAVCSSMIYRFWLHLWYLLVISSSMIYRFWLHPWCHSAIVLSVLLWFRDCDYPLVSFDHCVVCSLMSFEF